jgi:hypothetical protein
VTACGDVPVIMHPVCMVFPGFVFLLVFPLWVVDSVFGVVYAWCHRGLDTCIVGEVMYGFRG